MATNAIRRARVFSDPGQAAACRSDLTPILWLPESRTWARSELSAWGHERTIGDVRDKTGLLDNVDPHDLSADGSSSSPATVQNSPRRFGGRNRPPETKALFRLNRPWPRVSGAGRILRNRANSGHSALNGLVVSLHKCAWWARQSDRCRSHPEFPANRENNREYSRFWASKSTRNVTSPHTSGLFEA